MDGLDADAAAGEAVLGGTVVENVPLAAPLTDGAVVVPGAGVAERIVHDDAAARIGAK